MQNRPRGNRQDLLPASLAPTPIVLLPLPPWGFHPRYQEFADRLDAIASRSTPTSHHCRPPPPPPPPAPPVVCWRLLVAMATLSEPTCGALCQQLSESFVSSEPRARELLAHRKVAR